MVVKPNRSGGARYPTGYTDLSDHGLIGDMHSAALISISGTVASYCFPYFDSPSMFARILDKDHGGHWSVTTTTETSSKQSYVPSTNLLTTKFLSERGVGQLTDFMPLPGPGRDTDPKASPWLVRKVETIRGKLSYHMELAPAFDYARASHDTQIVSDEPALAPAATPKFGIAPSSRPSSPLPGAGPTSSPGPAALNKSLGGMSLSAGGDGAREQISSQHKKVLFNCDTHANMQLQYILASEGDAPEPTLTIDYLDLSERGHKGLGVSIDFTLDEGQSIAFFFREQPKTSAEESTTMPLKPPPVSRVTGQAVPTGPASAASDWSTAGSDDIPIYAGLYEAMFKSTQQYWLKWVSQCKYTGRWRETVQRSALAIKLMTFEPTGALIAAPTFSLPEDLNGAGRNWDYRFTWLRDSSFSLYALLRLGFTHEAERYMDFLTARIRDGRNEDGGLQIMYTIHGGREAPELVLEELDGHKGQKPVHIGNGAVDHLQLDVYGAVLDAVYLYQKHAKPLTYDQWLDIRSIVDYVSSNWDQPDLSIWEVRGAKQNFVYSKVMMWVALDRGLRLAEKHSNLPLPQRDVWRDSRDRLYEEVMEKGFNKDTQTFTQTYENDALDASLLIMVLTFFINGNDPRFLSTLQAILRKKEKGGLTEAGLVFRYDTDKIDDGTGGGEEGGFSMCICWAIEALTRAGEYEPAYLDQASIMLEDFLGFSNHLGLMSEEISKGGEQLGNTPQGFTHMAIVSTCYALDRALNKAGKMH